MPQRRPPHKTAHVPCPYGQTNWSDCDVAHAHRFGPCRAVVGDREPEPCSRWAADEDGWCAQHWTALHEKQKQKAREAERKLQLDQRIAAYIEWTREHPSVWDSPNAPKGVAAGAGVEPATSRVTADRSTAELPRSGRATRNKPHRLTELA